MARISDAVLQGLMNPQFGFTGLAEPIGMLMGGAQAQRQAQQRQMEAIQGALGAQDIGGLQEVLKGLKPDEVQNVLAVFSAGQQARAQQAEQKRQRTDVLVKDAEEIAARTSAVRHAVINEKDPETGIMLRSAPMSVVNAYLQDKVIPKEDAGNFEFFSAPGGVAVVDPATGKVTFEASPYGQKPAKAKGQVNYTKPDGSVVSLTTDEFGRVKFNGVEGLPEQFGLSAQPKAPAEGKATQERYMTPEGNIVNITTPASGVIKWNGQEGFPEDFGLTVAPEPADVSKTVETELINTLERINNLDGDVRIADSALSTLTYIDPETKQVKVKEERMGGLLGGMLSETRKKFGAGNEFDIAYASLRGMNAEEILQYLPPGPASNADMIFVKEAGLDPNSLSNEDLADFLRIYKQVKQGQREKELAYSSWLSSKNTTAGFASNWALTKAYQRKEQLPNYASFEKMIANANRIPDPVAKSAELQRLATEFKEEYKIYNDIKTYQQQVDDFNKRNR